MDTILDQTNLISQQYVVTFNDAIGTYQVGDTGMKSIDYFGPDINILTTTVIDYEAKSDYGKRPSRQHGTLNFNPIPETNNIIGLFYDTNNKLIAIMYKWV